MIFTEEERARLQERTRSVGLHFAKRADDDMQTAYTSLTTLKSDMDQADEIPASHKRLYDAVTKAISMVASAKKQTHQVRMMARNV